MNGITNFSSLFIVIAVLILFAIGVRQALLKIHPYTLEQDTSVTTRNESPDVPSVTQPLIKQSATLTPSYLDENTDWNEPELYVDAIEPGAPSNNFTCEGKQRCSEMNSCAEALFYLENCPSVEIDGDWDGIPCEQQFCGH